jgi:hypothetical protein
MFSTHTRTGIDLSRPPAGHTPPPRFTPLPPPPNTCVQVSICRAHLLPALLVEHGLGPHMVEFRRDTLEGIIHGACLKGGLSGGLGVQHWYKHAGVGGNVAHCADLYAQPQPPHLSWTSASLPVQSHRSLQAAYRYIWASATDRYGQIDRSICSAEVVVQLKVSLLPCYRQH